MDNKIDVLLEKKKELEDTNAKNIIYYENGKTIDLLPNNYLYINGEGIKVIELKKEDNNYILPKDYQLAKLNDEVVGIKKIKPKTITVDKVLSYDIIKNSIIESYNIYYDDNKKELITTRLTKYIGDNDLITFCNKDDYTKDNFLYIPQGKSGPEPIRYIEKEISEYTNDKEPIDYYEENNKKYKVDRVVIFLCSNNVERKSLPNYFACKLKLGEKMFYIKEDKKQVVYGIYSKYNN